MIGGRIPTEKEQQQRERFLFMMTGLQKTEDEMNDAIIKDVEKCISGIAPVDPLIEPYFVGTPKLDTVTVKMNFDNTAPMDPQTKPYVAGVLKRSPITFDIDNYAFEKKVVKDTKLGQKVHLHIPVSDTHEVKITSQVVSKRKVRRK